MKKVIALSLLLLSGCAVVPANYSASVYFPAPAYEVQYRMPRALPELYPHYGYGHGHHHHW